MIEVIYVLAKLAGLLFGAYVILGLLSAEPHDMDDWYAR